MQPNIVRGQDNRREVEGHRSIVFLSKPTDQIHWKKAVFKHLFKVAAYYNVHRTKIWLWKQKRNNYYLYYQAYFFRCPQEAVAAHTKQTFVGPNCSHVAYNLKTLLCCGLFVRSGDPQSYICLRGATIGQTGKTIVLPTVFPLIVSAETILFWI